MDNLTYNLYFVARGKDTDKQNSSAQLACVCQSRSHLAAIYLTKGEVIFKVVNLW